MTQKKAVKNQSLIRGKLAASMLEVAPFAIFKSGQYIEEKFSQMFLVPPLKLRHYVVLRVLTHAEAKTQQELSEALWIDRATMTGLIKDLLSQRMVKRIFNENDRRSFILSVTPTGQKYYRQFEKTFVEIERQIFPNLSEREFRAIREILAKALAGVAQ